MRVLECPKCREPLVVVEYGGVEIDWCLSCRGIWLDGGELEALVGEPVPPKDEPETGLGEAERDCPICVDKLVKEYYGHTKVLIDRCPHGDGIWLDEGELEAIRAAYGKGQPPDEGHYGQAAGALSHFFQASPAAPAGEAASTAAEPSDSEPPRDETS